MKNNLVIVESPAKARTLSQILDKTYDIRASKGHVRDLPKKTLGIDITDDFTPRYTVLPDRKKFVAEIKAAMSDVKAIYLATDPDREGEAISWHLIEAAKLAASQKPLLRVVFHEITNDAVKAAFKNPRSLDMDLVNAQQARRLLDRLVGYKLSPFLWKKVLRGLSAGRVQSAAVRIIVDREREILSFKPVEYWTIDVELKKDVFKETKSNFLANLISMADRSKVSIKNESESNSICGLLKKSTYEVSSIQNKLLKKQPSAPFITSTMQQEAWRKFHFTAKRTMAIAQQLYEGISLGSEGIIGLITYIRTDSTHLAPGAVSETRELIKTKYGEDYVPAKPRLFTKKGKFTQEAHEAIRPTKVFREPALVQKYLRPEQNKLYELIWKRMVACQMAESIYEIITIEIISQNNIGPSYLLKTSNTKLKFPGFTLVYSEGKDEEEKEENAFIPKLKEGERLNFVEVYPKQNFTEPPARYNEATLIRALEQKGIGRPSTYAPIISTIQDREYVHKENGRFKPGEIGFIVNDLLVKNFPKIVDLNFTAKIENDLDKIASGKKEWVSVLREFYQPFSETLDNALTTVEKVKTDVVSDQLCPECGKSMLIKYGRFGKFLACSGYPECKKTMPILTKIGVSCPECGQAQGGELVQRRSKNKMIFYGCSRYPECHFITRYKPIPKPCPDCGKLLVEFRKGQVRCLSCDFKSAEVASEA